jgi:ferredoxin
MVTPVISQKTSFSVEFYNKLFEVADGERIRTCLQCGTCSGICPFGYIMDFPPGLMITALRAEMFDEVMATDSVWMCVSCYACFNLSSKILHSWIDDPFQENRWLVKSLPNCNLPWSTHNVMEIH